MWAEAADTFLLCCRQLGSNGVGPD